MLLRSSSTPVLGSLLSSFSESPSSNHHQSELHGATPKHTPPSVHQSCSKISCSNGIGSQNIGRSLLGSPSVAEIKGFRRVQSEGNLEDLANASYNVDEFSFSDHYHKKFARKPNRFTLEAIPSFSVHNFTSFEDEDNSDEEELEEFESDGESEIEQFRVENYASQKSRNSEKAFGNFAFQTEGKMYIAAGLGIASGDESRDSGGGRGGSSPPVGFNRGGGDSDDISIKEHYEKMLTENPGNPLFLRNYAQFLYQTKKDLTGAEEYYSRAILADPEDGEILSQYARLIWELHQDEDRASSYFERAVQASPENSHIHAAYASFLWDVDDDEEEKENAAENLGVAPSLLNPRIMASAIA